MSKKCKNCGITIYTTEDKCESCKDNDSLDIVDLAIDTAVIIDIFTDDHPNPFNSDNSSSFDGFGGGDGGNGGGTGGDF